MIAIVLCLVLAALTVGLVLGSHFAGFEPVQELPLTALERRLRETIAELTP